MISQVRGMPIPHQWLHPQANRCGREEQVKRHGKRAEQQSEAQDWRIPIPGCILAAGLRRGRAGIRRILWEKLVQGRWKR